jgi:opacity protein-like surface antigen
MIKFLTYAFLSSLLSFPIFAKPNTSYKLCDLCAHPLLSLSGGPAWINPGTTQNLYLDYDYNNAYRPNSNQQPIGFAEVYLALQKNINTNVANQFGVAFSGSWMAKVNGQVWQYNDPLFYNYDYTYNLRQLRLALRDKIIYEQGIFDQKMMPYITGSVGLGFNQSYTYSETPLSSSIIANPAFSNKSLNAFTYSVGAGLQTCPWNHFVFGVGYEFMDWGRSALGAASGQVLNVAPSMSHLYMNTLLFSITFTV